MNTTGILTKGILVHGLKVWLLRVKGVGRTGRVTTHPKSSDLKVGQSKSGGVSLDQGSRDCLLVCSSKTRKTTADY